MDEAVMEYERKHRLWQARINYMHSILSPEMMSDALLNGIANQYCERDDFTVEGCLIKMVSLSLRAKKELEQKTGTLSATSWPILKAT